MTNNTSRLTVSANGNVGIGTIPNAKLTINGAAVSMPQIISTGANLDLSLSHTLYLQSAAGSTITNKFIYSIQAIQDGDSMECFVSWVTGYI